MRHRKHSNQLGVKKEHRIALMANLATALLKHGRIQTTLPKAKALRPFVEKIITMAKKAKTATPERALYLRRLAIARVRDKSVVHNLFESRVEEFMERNGGYTRIYKLGARIGDAAEMALIELIDGADEGYKSSRRKKTKKSRAKKSVASQQESVSEVETIPAPEAEEENSVEPEAVEANIVEESEPEAETVAEVEAETVEEDIAEEPVVEAKEAEGEDTAPEEDPEKQS